MNVYIFQVILRRDLEYCTYEMERISRALKPLSAQRAMHCSRNIAFVVITRESEENLMKRFADVLNQDCVEAVWCYAAPEKIVSNRPGLDSLETRVRLAYAQIGKWKQSQNVRNIQVPRIRPKVNRPERFVGSASVEMARQAKAKWRPSRDPNKPKR